MKGEVLTNLASLDFERNIQFTLQKKEKKKTLKDFSEQPQITSVHR